MRLNLTDLAIQRLKHPDKGQVRYFDTTVPAFGITVGTKAKTFFVIHGTARRLTTLGRYPSQTLKIARRDAQRILLDGTTFSTPTTYLEAVQSFIAARRGKVKDKTLARYQFYLEKLAFTGKVDTLTRKEIMDRMSIYDGKDRAQNACFSILRTFLNWCVAEEIINRHPVYRAMAPNVVPSRTRVLTDDELVKIWNAADFQPYGHIVRLAILTAGRKEEVRNLIHDDEHITFKDTKNGTDHTLPITPLIRAHLMAPYQFNNWQRAKERFDKLCGVTGWRLHDLRRTWATNAGKLGVRPETIERVLNHKLTGVKAVYQRWHYMPEMREALLTVEAHITKITTAKA